MREVLRNIEIQMEAEGHHREVSLALKFVHILKRNLLASWKPDLGLKAIEMLVGKK